MGGGSVQTSPPRWGGEIGLPAFQQELGEQHPELFLTATAFQGGP
nr:MAG TPA: hypothetical protein [Caudoviricetes sp.]